MSRQGTPRMKDVKIEKIIPPKNASVFVVKKGQYLRTIDIEGQQVGDFVLFNEQYGFVYLH